MLDPLSFFSFFITLFGARKETITQTEALKRWHKSRSGFMPKNDLIRSAMRDSVVEMLRIVCKSLLKEQPGNWSNAQTNWCTHFFSDQYLLKRENGAITRFTEQPNTDESRTAFFDLEETQISQFFSGNIRPEDELARFFNTQLLAWVKEEWQLAEKNAEENAKNNTFLTAGLEVFTHDTTILDNTTPPQQETLEQWFINTGVPVTETVYGTKRSLALTPFAIFIQTFHEKVKHQEGVFEITASIELAGIKQLLEDFNQNFPKNVATHLQPYFEEIKQQLGTNTDLLSLTIAGINDIENNTDILLRRFQPTFVSIQGRQSNPSTTAENLTSENLTFRKQWLDYIPRGEPEQQLENFLYQDKPFSWWAVEASGGMGKSRMALELVQQANSSGWQAGFLCPSNIKSWIKDESFKSWNPITDTLLVIDYASVVSSVLKLLLQHFSTEPTLPNTRLRILLLDRPGFTKPTFSADFSKEGGHTSSDESIINTLYSPQNQNPNKNTERKLKKFSSEDCLQLKPLTENEASNFLQTVLQKLGIKAAEIQDKIASISKEELSRLTKNSPLFLQILAQILAKNPDKNITFKTEQDLLKEWVNHLKIIWKEICTSREICFDKEKERLYQAISLVTLIQGIQRPFPENYKVYAKDNFPPFFGEVLLDCLSSSTTKENYCNPLEPDPIAEYFVLTHASKQDPTKGSEFLIAEEITLAAQNSPTKLGSFLHLLTNDYREHPTTKQIWQHAVNAVSLEDLSALDKATTSLWIDTEAILSVIKNSTQENLDSIFTPCLQTVELEKKQTHIKALLLNEIAFIAYFSDKVETAILLWENTINLRDAPLEHKAKALLVRGFLFGKQNNPKAATEDYSTLIKLPGAPLEHKAMALLDRGFLFGKQNEPEKAIEDYSTLIKLPGAPLEHKAKALLNRGITFGEQNNPEKAIKDYSTLIDLQDAPLEQKANALFNRGIAFGNQNNPEKAIKDYSTLIDLPGAPLEQKARALLNRGITFGEQNNPEEAIKDYSTLIDLQDTPLEHKAEALFNRGNTFREQNNPEAAIKDYSTLIDLPGAPLKQKAKALLNRGNTFREQNNPEKAIEDYSTLIKLPGAPLEHKANALLNRGIAFGNQNNPEKAIKDYSTLIDLQDAPLEQKAKALFNRGNTFREQNNPEAAIKDYSTLIDLPGAPLEQKANALLNRGNTFREQNNPEKAIKDYSTLIKLPGAPLEQKANALFNRGIAFGNQNNPEAAKADLQQCLQISQPNSEAHHRAQQVLSLLQQHENPDQ